MRNFLLRIPENIPLLWQRVSSQRLAKLGGFILGAFVLIAGINLIFGSREAATASSNQTLGIAGVQDGSNLPFEFQFLGQGQITGGSDDRWLIGNVPIQVGEHTLLNGNLHPDDFVTLSGRILEDGVWLADRIELAQEGKSFFTFNGPLEWVRGIAWRIGGLTLLTDPETRLGGDLMVSDLLLATFTVLDNGAWLALEIKAFERFPLEPTPIPTPTKAQERVEIFGLVEEMGGITWIVSEKTVRIVQSTEITGQIDVGDSVKVVAIVKPDGSLTARQIELIDDNVNNSLSVEDKDVDEIDNVNSNENVDKDVDDKDDKDDDKGKDKEDDKDNDKGKKDDYGNDNDDDDNDD